MILTPPLSVQRIAEWYLKLDALHSVSPGSDKIRSDSLSPMIMSHQRK